MQKKYLLLFLCCGLLEKTHTAASSADQDSQEQSLTSYHSQELEGSQDPDRESKIKFKPKAQVKTVASPQHNAQMIVMHNRPRDLGVRRHNTDKNKARKAKGAPRKTRVATQLNKQQMKLKDSRYKKSIEKAIKTLETIQNQGQTLDSKQLERLQTYSQQLELYNTTHE